MIFCFKNNYSLDEFNLKIKTFGSLNNVSVKSSIVDTNSFITQNEGLLYEYDLAWRSACSWGTSCSFRQALGLTPAEDLKKCQQYPSKRYDSIFVYNRPHRLYFLPRLTHTAGLYHWTWIRKETKPSSSEQVSEISAKFSILDHQRYIFQLKA